MSNIIIFLFQGAFSIWNGFINVAIEMFTDSPKTAGAGTLYMTIKEIFDGISACTIPLATLFFIIAIYKTISSTPPEQQARKFILDVIKYVLILYITSKLWDILGYIIDFSDGITTSVAGGATINCDIDIYNNPFFTNVSRLSLTANMPSDPLDFVGIVGTIFENMASFILYFVGAFISMIVLAFAGLSVVGVAFQRILKPLIILPFGAIILGMGACSGEGERLMWHYGKSFLGFCLSGAFMVVAIRLGSTFVTDCVFPIDSSSPEILQAILQIVQVNIGALVITGLVNSMDGIIGKVLG